MRCMQPQTKIKSIEIGLVRWGLDSVQVHPDRNFTEDAP